MHTARSEKVAGKGKPEFNKKKRHDFSLDTKRLFLKSHIEYIHLKESNVGNI